MDWVLKARNWITQSVRGISSRQGTACVETGRRKIMWCFGTQGSLVSLEYTEITISSSLKNADEIS